MPTPLQPTAFVIFGGGGDLTWRKLMPALFNLYLDRTLPDTFTLLGLDRLEMTDEAFRQHLREGVDRFSRRGPARDPEWEAFAAYLNYLQMDFADEGAYSRLGERLKKLDDDWKAKADRIFYLAIPPALIGTIVPMLGKAGLAQQHGRTRIVVEKPIGHDLESALNLNRTLTAHFRESQIFRIDHYLGKETVQNLLALRFANAVYEPVWNRRYVDHVAITVAEEVGVEHRGGYYDHAGALRDMVQNHLLQLLCLVAMEPPVSLHADEIRNKKVDVLHAVRPIPHDDVPACAARGQYGEGWLKGKHVPAYRQEEGVAPDSTTETFAALKLFVDNWRWQDVPFYLRTGKRLPQHVSEISIRFRAVPHRAFPSDSTLDWEADRLVICIEPEEGIVLKFQAKQPGPRMRLLPVDMRFGYRDTFKAASPDAYETLLWDIMIDDGTLFMRADQVEAAWSLLMPVLDVWAASPPSDFPNYAAGNWGPEAAEALIARDGRSWHQPTVLQEPPGVGHSGHHERHP
jgi:glucose-6-phosphate 1-dehydrogenase